MGGSNYIRTVAMILIGDLHKKKTVASTIMGGSKCNEKTVATTLVSGYNYIKL